MDGVHLACKNCKVSFFVCRKCWRGQSYCSQNCSKKARTLSTRRSQKKYSATPKVRQLHSLRQKRYRKNHHRHKNSETDQTTLFIENSVNAEQRRGRCMSCDVKITIFIVPTGFYSFRRSHSACSRQRYNQKF